MRREEPIEIARTGAVEPELDRRLREPGDDARLEIHLQVDDEIEPTFRELLADVGKPPPAVRTFEKDDFVD